MDLQPDDSTAEIKRLQRCINDLLGILALPAVWTGGDASQIVRTLIDALAASLRLDLVYAKVNDPDGAAHIEMSRVGQSLNFGAAPRELGEILCRRLGQDLGKWPMLARFDAGEEELSIVPLRLGLQGEMGVIAAGSRRADFPGQTERLLLSVAANQAAVGLQEARRMSEQKQIADELDRRVAHRTAELAAANQELQREIAEHKRADEELHAIETNFRRIVDSVPGLVCTMNPGGEIELLNRELVEYFGKTPDELKSWQFTDAVHPDDLPRVVAAFTHSIATGNPYDIEHRCRRGDGVYLWFHVRALPVRDSGGSITGWYVMLIDIDDRKRAENAIRANERNLDRIINTIPTLAWCNRPDGSNEFLSQPWHDYTGLSPEEAHGWGWQVTIHPDDLPKLLDIWQRLLRSGESGELEARLRRRDGVFRWFLFRVNPLRDDSGEIVKWYGTNTDIDDLKRAEEELRRNEAFLIEGQRLSLTGTFSWRVDTDELTFSDELHRIFDFEPDTPVTLERIGARVHPEDIPLMMEKIEHSRAGGGDLEYEIRLRMQDGSVKYLRTYAHGMRHPSGQLEYIGAVQDVTQRRLSDEALSKARSDLAHVSRVMSLGALTASIAHEVNQPLSGIITNAGTCLRMLAADPPNLEGARETALRTIRDGNRASDVIARLRALFAKKEAPTEAVDLNEAAREVIALSVSELQRNRVVLRSEFDDALPPITADRVQLQQVILNLILNASQAMSDVENRPRLLLITTDCDEHDDVRLTVRDAGIGFVPGQLEKLFDPFYTTKSGGMGIGLSVSRSIIERHRGRLWALPNEGQGATFSFSIPRGTSLSPDRQKLDAARKPAAAAHGLARNS